MKATTITRALALAAACSAALVAQDAQKTPVEKILGESENLAFVDVDVFVGDGKKLEKVTVLVEDGKIQKIGKGLAVPRSARRVEGGCLTPGWVLLGSRAGVQGASRGRPQPTQTIVINGRRMRMSRNRGSSSSSGAFTPNVKVSDRLDIKSKDFADWLRVGVTTHGLRPVSNGLSGMGAVASAHAEDKESMLLADESFLWLGMSSSTKSKKTIRDGFTKAKELIEARKKAKSAPKPSAKPADAKKAAKPDASKAKPTSKTPAPEPSPKPAPKPSPKPSPKPAPAPKPAQGKTASKPAAKPATKKPAPKKEDPRHATLAKSLEGKLPVLLGISSLRDLLHAEQALESFKVPVTVYHAFRRGAADTLDHAIPLLKKLEAKVVCSADLGAKPATAVLTNPIAKLQSAGVPVVLTPGARVDDVKNIWVRLGELHRSGAKAEQLIESLTLAPAKMLGVDKRVGSIAKDKDANFLHFSRNPFSPASRLLNVYFEGRKVENVKTRSDS